MKWLSLLFLCCFSLFTAANSSPLHQEQNPQVVETSRINSFTGQITSSRVRLRAASSLDSHIIDEIDKGSLFVVTGEENDFYAVLPSDQTKVYVFRTYIIDQTIEGDHVNVRLTPSLESPILTQLNTGERIEGKICEQNNRWFAITPPPSVRFYIAKEYVQRIGGPELIQELQKRKKEATQILTATKTAGHQEFNKPFPQIQIDPVLRDLQSFSERYTNFPELIEQANELLFEFHERYIQTKLAYLEQKLENSSKEWEKVSLEIQEEVNSQQHKFSTINNASTTPIAQENSNYPNPLPNQEQQWNQIEDQLFLAWKSEQSDPSITQEKYYEEQQIKAVHLKGTIQEYDRPVKNKPGNYILLNNFSQLPTAYLYSTQVDLTPYIGKEVALKAAPRPKHNFVFPAYFVLEIETSIDYSP